MKIIIIISQGLRNLGFPGSSDGKEYVCQCRKLLFDPWVGKIPWRREWLPTPVFLTGEFHEHKSLVGYSPWGCKESYMTERLTLAYLSNPSMFTEPCFIGEKWGRSCGSDPWVGKITWSRKWQPAPVFLPGQFHAQKGLVGHRPWGHRELDTTDLAYTGAYTSTHATGVHSKWKEKQWFCVVFPFE